MSYKTFLRLFLALLFSAAFMHSLAYTGRQDKNLTEQEKMRVHTENSPYLVNAKEYCEVVMGQSHDTSNYSIVLSQILNNYEYFMDDNGSLSVRQHGLTIYFPAGVYDFRDGNIELSIVGFRSYHNLVIKGAPRQGALWDVSDMGGTVLNCDFLDDPFFLISIDYLAGGGYDSISRPENDDEAPRAVVIQDLFFKAPNLNNGIKAIKGWTCEEVEIRNCVFAKIDTAIDFNSQFGDSSVVSFSDGIIIDNVSIRDAEVGIILAHADYSRVSSLQFYNGSANAKYGVFVRRGMGLAFTNLLINGISDQSGAAIYFDFVHSAKLSGIHCESNHGYIYDINDGCTGISIDGSAAAYSYKRLLKATSARNCELKNHYNYNVAHPADGIDIELDTSQFSINNLSSNNSYAYATDANGDDIGTSASHFHSTQGISTAMPFLLSRDDYHKWFEVDNLGKVTTYLGQFKSVCNNFSFKNGIDTTVFSIIGDTLKSGNMHLKGANHPRLTIEGSTGNGGVLSLKCNTGVPTNIVNCGGNMYLQAGGVNAQIIKADGNVGINTTDPQRKLHVKDVMRLEPRGSAPSPAYAGDIYYNSTLKKLMVHDGTDWRACW